MSMMIVDCEASGPCPGKGELTEFGAVDFDAYYHEQRREGYHGVLRSRDGLVPLNDPVKIFRAFADWLREHSRGRAIFVSDNPAFDWQWINHGFWHTLDRNPFGHSARRISDFYAGLMGDLRETRRWKRLRITPHDHNPLHDAMGNAEALARLLRGER